MQKQAGSAWTIAKGYSTEIVICLTLGALGLTSRAQRQRRWRLKGTEKLQELRSVTAGQQVMMNKDVFDVGCQAVGAGSITGNAPLPSKSKEIDNCTGVTVRVGWSHSASSDQENHPSKVN